MIQIKLLKLLNRLLVTMEGEMNTILKKHTASFRNSQTSRLWLAVVAAMVLLAPGCTIFHPLRGVPASYLPDEFEGPSRSGKNTINLGLLTRTPPKQHLVSSGDVLSIYVPRVLGRISTEIRDVGIEPPINTPNAQDDPPTLGYPITVRDDHTISLPQLPPINVYGMTIQQVEDKIRQAYTIERQIIQPEEAMVLVSLQRARVHRVLVVRQEFSNDNNTAGGGAGSLNQGASKRGTARTVTLRSGENDVMHALSMVEGADGLPGLDAKNTIYIIRRRNGQQQGMNCPQPGLGQTPSIMQMNYEVPAEQTVRGQNSNILQTAHSMQAAPTNPSPYGSYRGVTQTNGMQTASQPVQAASGHSITAGPIVATHRMGSPYASPHSKQVHGMGGHSLNSIAPMQHNTPSPIMQAQHTNPSPYAAMNPQLTGMPNTGMPLEAQPQFQPIPELQPHLSSMQLPATHNGLMQLQPHLQSQFPPPSQYPVQQNMAGPMQGFAASLPVEEPHWRDMLSSFDPTIESPNVIKIPVRLADGETPHFTEQDVTLEDGDIVFIESRETEVFYTGGLLGGGQYTLPRDYDLHVLEALSIAEGRNLGGGTALKSIGGVSALNQDVATSASRLVILRKLPNGQRITIEVDLHKAMRYQQEDILVQPGDMLILSYTFPEAVAAFTQRFLLEGALIGIATSTFTSGGGGGS